MMNPTCIISTSIPTIPLTLIPVTTTVNVTTTTTTATILDSVSSHHLHQLILECLQDEKLNLNYTDSIETTLHQLSNHITDDILSRLATTHALQSRAKEQIILEHKQHNTTNHRHKDNNSTGGVVSSSSDSVQQQISLRARQLLSPTTTTATHDTTPTQPQLTSLDLTVRNHIVLKSAADLTFQWLPQEFTKTPLFTTADDDSEVAREDTNVHDVDGKDERVGGTLEIKSTSKDAPKLHQVLQFLVYALLSNRLEQHLRRDLSSLRPEIEEEPEVEPEVLEESDRVDSSSAVTSPSPTETILVEQSKKSKWSGANLWNLMGKSSLKKSNQNHSIDLHRSLTTPASLSPPSTLRHLFDSVKYGKSGHHQNNKSTNDHGGASGNSATSVKGFRMRRTRSQRVEGSSASLVIEEIEKGWDFVDGLSSSNHRRNMDMVVEEGGTSTKNQRVEQGSTTQKDKESEKVERVEPLERFANVIGKMKGAILSTSVDVAFPPPHLLLRLREQEIEQSRLNPPPSSSSALLSATTRTSASGIEAGSSSSNVVNPVRMRISIDARAGIGSMMTNNASLQGKVQHQSIQFLVESTVNDSICSPPILKTYSYFDTDSTLRSEDQPCDLSIGEFIRRIIEGADSICAVGCGKKGREHEIVMSHSEQKIVISLKELEGPIKDEMKLVSPLSTTDSPIFAWTTCSTCSNRSSLVRMSMITATLFSSSKYFELLLYDVSFLPFPQICEHDKEMMIRCFAIGDIVMEMTVRPITLYELRLPTSIDPLVKVAGEPSEKVTTIAEEIRSFYASLQRRCEVVKAALVVDLPEKTDREIVEEKHSRRGSEDTISGIRDESGSTLKKGNRHLLLQHLIQTFADDESDLLIIASETQPQHANNARHPFISRARANVSRLAAWELKHLSTSSSSSSSSALPPPSYSQPDYFDASLHVFPVDSSVIVRNTELSSLIALTLSATIFKEEVQFMATVTPLISRKPSPQTYRGVNAVSAVMGGGGGGGLRKTSTRLPISNDLFLPPTPAFASESRSSTPPRSPLVRATKLAPPLDPDDPSDFVPLETVDFIAKPSKSAGRTGGGGSSILSLRGTSRQRSTDSFISSTIFGLSPFGTPATELSQIDGGLGTTTTTTISSDNVLLDELIVKEEKKTSNNKLSLHSARTTPSIISSLSNKRHSSAPSTTSTLSVAAEIDLRGAGGGGGSIGSSIASLASIGNGGMTPTPRGSSSRNSIVEEDNVGGQDERNEEEKETREEKKSNHLSTTASISSTSSSTPAATATPPLITATSTSTAGRTSTIISGSLKALWNLPGSLRLRETSQPENAGHIKFKFSEGETVFRVTAYYAKSFQNLRSVCGLDEELFIESLSRCTSLVPSGGKSKSVFLETRDQRFILKELVTNWVSERDGFLAFAPALIEYLSSPEKPSLLAKIYGFYTIKIKNTRTGEVERKLDLVVMENLLHSVSVTRQFDLKGIPTRTAKEKETTLLDSEWLNGSGKEQVLLYSHSKNLLLQSLANDTAFLAAQELIDYSLLVGVDDVKKEVVVGLIDTLGVYNVAKLLENRGKTTLAALAPLLKSSTASEEVTVIPPTEYATRFRSSMIRYFIAVPEKFSRPPGVAESRLMTVAKVL